MPQAYRRNWKKLKGGTHHATFSKTAVALGFIGAIAIGTTVAVQAQGVYFGYGYYPQPYYHGYYYHRHYARYGYYGGGGWNTGNGSAHRVGPGRAASVSPFGMVPGTSMEGGRATTDINNMRRPLRRPSLLALFNS